MKTFATYFKGILIDLEIHNLFTIHLNKQFRFHSSRCFMFRLWSSSRAKWVDFVNKNCRGCIESCLNRDKIMLLNDLLKTLVTSQLKVLLLMIWIIKSFIYHFKKQSHKLFRFSSVFGCQGWRRHVEKCCATFSCDCFCKHRFSSSFSIEVRLLFINIGQ